MINASINHFFYYLVSCCAFFLINNSLAIKAIAFQVFFYNLRVFLERLLFKSRVVFLGKIFIFPSSYRVSNVRDFIYAIICFYSSWQSLFTGIILEFFFSFQLRGQQFWNLSYSKSEGGRPLQESRYQGNYTRQFMGWVRIFGFLNVNYKSL